MATRKARYSVNTTRKVGGRLLGEGVTGKTYNAACSASGNSFCKEIKGQEDAIIKILLYTPENIPIKLTKQDELHSFVTYLRNLDGIITKILKPPPKFLKKSIKTLFHNELDANREIIKIYGTDAKKYLTIAPISYDNKDVIGAQVFLKSKIPLYVIFGYKCNNRFKLQTNKELKAWASDILESVSILQKRNYLHNDIKPDNTVLCDKTYKLIDWGFACHMDYKSFKVSDGDDMFITPLRWYIVGKPKEVAIEKLMSKTERKNKRLFQSSLWQEFMAYFTEELEYAFSSGLSHEQLFSKYKDSFDVIMVGLTILEVVHDSKLSWSYWGPIVKKLVSHKNPIDAQQALKLVA
jgi:serine/threonine protein kinase